MKRFSAWSLTRGLTICVATLSAVTGCSGDEPENPPADQIVADNIGTLYQQTAPGLAVSDPRLLGKHYVPNEDGWRIVFCANVTFADSEPVSDCNDSFRLYVLDTGRWIVSGTTNGVYRWQEVVVEPPASE